MNHFHKCPLTFLVVRSHPKTTHKNLQWTKEIEVVNFWNIKQPYVQMILCKWFYGQQLFGRKEGLRLHILAIPNSPWAPCTPEVSLQYWSALKVTPRWDSDQTYRTARLVAKRPSGAWRQTAARQSWVWTVPHSIVSYSGMLCSCHPEHTQKSRWILKAELFRYGIVLSHRPHVSYCTSVQIKHTGQAPRTIVARLHACRTRERR